MSLICQICRQNSEQEWMWCRHLCFLLLSEASAHPRMKTCVRSSQPSSSEGTAAKRAQSQENRSFWSMGRRGALSRSWLTSRPARPVSILHRHSGGGHLTKTASFLQWSDPKPPGLESTALSSSFFCQTLHRLQWSSRRAASEQRDLV